MRRFEKEVLRILEEKDLIEKEEKKDLNPFGSFGSTQPEKKKPKVKKEYKALKTCRIRLEDGEALLVAGQPVEGLKDQELKNLKKAGLIE